MASAGLIIGMQAASALIGGAEDTKQGNAEAAALNENARRTELQGNIDGLTNLRETRMEDGAMSVANASAGVGAGSGSIGDILYANARARWESSMNIQASANAEAKEYRGQAKQAKKRGQAAMIGGIMQAGAAALGGMGKESAYQKTQSAIQGYRKFQLQGPARTSLVASSFGRTTVGGN